MAQYSPIGDNSPIGDVTGGVLASVSVSNSSVLVLAANENRRAIIFSNVGNRDCFLASGQTAIAEQCLLLKKGETRIITVELAGKEAINGITDAGSTTIGVQEFT